MLGKNINENLNWKILVHDLIYKLNGTNAVLSKLRYFVNFKILRSVYFAIFQSHFIDVRIA